MERDEKASGTITVYDGSSIRNSVLGVFPVSNGSFPQSVTTTGGSITIRFQYSLPPEPTDPKEHRCKNFRGCLRFLLDLTSYDGNPQILVYNASDPAYFLHYILCVDNHL